MRLDRRSHRESEERRLEAEHQHLTFSETPTVTQLTSLGNLSSRGTPQTPPLARQADPFAAADTKRRLGTGHKRIPQPTAGSPGRTFGSRSAGRPGRAFLLSRGHVVRRTSSTVGGVVRRVSGVRRGDGTAFTAPETASAWGSGFRGAGEVTVSAGREVGGER